MANQTDLSTSPYNDDFNEDKGYVRILYKPGVAVQTREMNQVQSIWQNQIERLSNNLFKRGTVIDGINFIFYDNYPYAKITDVQINGENAVPENYVGYFVKNEANLVARVIDYQNGFESSEPDLKTIYLKYLNSGNDYTSTAFSPGQILTVYDSNSSIFEIDVLTRGTGYSNSDIVVVTPQLLVNVTSGSFSIGDTITVPTTQANGIITSIVDQQIRLPLVSMVGTIAVNSGQANVVGTSTTFTSNFSNGEYVALYSNATYYEIKKINVVANSTWMNLTSSVSFTNVAGNYSNTSPSLVYVSYKPLSVDLANTSGSANSWTFTANSSLRGSTSTDLGTIVEVIGENAAGSILTDSVGRLDSITVTNRGNGYYRTPVVSIKTTSGASSTLAAYNYLAQISIASSPSSIGSGYAFGVTQGLIYQKGYFVKVQPQSIIVSKYSQIPDDVTVGFVTQEDIIDSNIDPSLRDNVLGEPNRNAPGADRLKLTAKLSIASINDAESDVDFFNLVEWSDGYPYKQNNRTAYNVINDQRAEMLSEQSGSFVVDRFLTTTTDPANSSVKANTVTILVDPGTAYVDGYRIQTLFNYSIEVDKATSTKTEQNSKVSLNYENYVRVNELGGFFEFDSGNQVELWSSTKTFLSNTSLITSGNTTPQGTKIGTARIRNFVFEQGSPGTPNAVYRLYLFNVSMDQGQNFRNVRSIYYNGAIKGIADVVLTPDSSTSSNIATIVARNNKLVFPIGYSSPLLSNNINYVYRTISETQDIANTGIISVSLTGLPGKTFPYTGTLSDSQKSEIYLAPQANLIAQSNLTGTVNVVSTSTSILGNGTDFVSQLSAGQYVNINGGASNNIIKRIVSITNSTFMTVDSNSSFSGNTITIKRAWPAYVPIQLQYNSQYTANVNGTGDVLSVFLGDTLATASNTDVIIGYNVENDNPTPTVKTPNREMLVKLRLANNAALTSGPWCLGVPDIFRLRGVYVGNSSVTTTSTDITSDFFIDHNQNSNYYNLGYLYQKNGSSAVLTQDDYLLVKFDAYTASPGFYTISSYVSSNTSTRFSEDSKPLANLSSTVSTFEIPEMFDDAGSYYDLMSQVDFRPYVTATANLTSNVSAITTNPSNVVAFSASDRYFPVPDSIFRHDLEYFVSRTDSVVLDKSGKISVLKGVPDSKKAPQTPSSTMLLNEVYQPPYPALPIQVNRETSQMLNTGVYSNKFMSERLNGRQIRSLFTEADFAREQPRAWTELDIGQIDRRLKDVEYYVSFNLLQSVTKDRIIPSSLSPNIDRFKYGFYVDDFDNENFSDYDSPEYAATITEGTATPALTSFNMVHLGASTSSNYASERILFQGSATTSNTVVTPTDVNYSGGMTIVPDHFKTQSYQVSSNSSSSSSSSSKSSKIVCTAMNEAYGFGSFRQTIWLEHSKNLDPAYERGYHAIFLPLVDWMYRSDSKNTKLAKLAKKVSERVARKRTTDIWMLKRGKRDLEGALYRAILEPLCYIVGKAKKAK